MRRYRTGLNGSRENGQRKRPNRRKLERAVAGLGGAKAAVELTGRGLIWKYGPLLAGTDDGQAGDSALYKETFFGGGDFSGDDLAKRCGEGRVREHIDMFSEAPTIRGLAFTPEHVPHKQEETLSRRLAAGSTNGHAANEQKASAKRKD